MKLQELAIAHLALCAAVLLWNLWAAGRAAQLRYAPRFLAAISGLGGLLVLPALAVHLLSGSLLTGRAFASIAWIWPLTVALVAMQAVYATTRGLLSPVIGIPIAIYDLLLALVYAAAYLADVGYPITEPLLVLIASNTTSMGLRRRSLPGGRAPGCRENLETVQASGRQAESSKSIPSQLERSSRPSVVGRAPLEQRCSFGR